MRFEDFLDQSAVQFATKAAIVADGRRITYGELEASSQRLANRLFERGVRRGDRVVVFMDNCPEAAISIFATLKAGGTFSVINASTKAPKLSYIIGDCEPVAVLTIGRLLPVVRSALGEIRVDRRPFVLSTGIDNDEARIGPFEASDQGLPNPVHHGGSTEDLAMLVYTSGSTGRPKGVMITHANIDAASGSIISYLGNRPDDVILNVLPLAFDYGLYQLLMSIRLGATLVLEKSFAFPSAIFARMREEKVTGLPLVPTMAALILQMRDLAANSVPSLRYITNTAAALPVDHIDRLRQLFPNAELFSMYGLTECKRCTYLPPADLDRKPGSVGIAIPGTQAFVVDAIGRVAGPGVVGELVIQGPHVMQGYWRNEEATARALRPGWPADALHRRSLHIGRRRLLVLCRPARRHHQDARRKGGAQGDRGGAACPSRRRRGSGRRRRRSDPRRSGIGAGRVTQRRTHPAGSHSLLRQKSRGFHGA
jgi:long-chain acyl-CoA synthetase